MIKVKILFFLLLTVYGILGGRNVFKSCVSRIVYLTGERDQILGKLNPQGERISGLIDKFSNSFSVSEIISYVAADTHHCGDTLEACKLYALAEVITKIF